MSLFPRYRIIRVEYPGDPCNWQLQRRHRLLFWRNVCGNVSSATTAANEMKIQMIRDGRSANNTASGQYEVKSKAGLPAYRIVHAQSKGEEHRWQLQKRHLLLFWRNVYGSVPSATKAAHEMERQMIAE